MRLFLKKRYENGSEIFAYLVDSVEGVILQLKMFTENRAPSEPAVSEPLF
jgi:hypothetical protein